MVNSEDHDHMLLVEQSDQGSHCCCLLLFFCLFFGGLGIVQVLLSFERTLIYALEESIVSYNSLHFCCMIWISLHDFRTLAIEVKILQVGQP